MKAGIGMLLLAAAFATAAPVGVASAQEAAQTQTAGNRIEGLEVAEHGGALYVRVTMKEPLAAPPASFSVSNPARIAFDFPDTANALGRSVQSIERGDLRSANIVQAGDRTRLVLNMVKVVPHDIRLQGRDVIIALTPVAPRFRIAMRRHSRRFRQRSIDLRVRWRRRFDAPPRATRLPWPTSGLPSRRDAASSVCRRRTRSRF